MLYASYDRSHTQGKITNQEKKKITKTQPTQTNKLIW